VQESKAFLGVGWRFPISADTDQIVSVAKYEQSIEDSIRIILSTSKGERRMFPEFGCNLNDYVFETINVVTITRIKNGILDALRLWEPRIVVNEIKVHTDKIDQGKLIISLSYTILSVNNRKNLVYDFYLKEGI